MSVARHAIRARTRLSIPISPIRLIRLMKLMLQAGSAKKREVILYLKDNRQRAARASYRCFFDVASKQSDGIHLSAITQNSRHGGRPVYSASNSKCRPVGNRFPDSHLLTVPIETPRSLATCFSGIFDLSRQLRNAVAKLPRMSQWSFDPSAMSNPYPKLCLKERLISCQRTGGSLVLMHGPCGCALERRSGARHCAAIR